MEPTATAWNTPSRRSKYPWAEWTDGKYKLIFFERDFPVDCANMRVQLYNRAAKQGLRVATTFIPVQHDFFGNETAGILFRFLRPGDEDFSWEASIPHLREHVRPSILESHARFFAST